MVIALGEGSYRYQLACAGRNWGELPDGWRFGDVAAVGVDRHDNLYVFARGDHPMTVFDRDGHFLRSWGEGVFKRPHGVHMGADDTIYCTDDGDHTVRKYTLDGKLLLTIGTSGKPAPFMSGLPFHRCTHTALAPNGDIYVSDGYGNARVHRYDANGKLIASWGEPGTRRGQFNIVHNICCDADGYVYVADRENHRIQVFDANGKYQTEWHDLYRPCGLCLCCANSQKRFYVAVLAPGQEFSNRNWPNLGPRISILGESGQLLARLGDYGGPERPSPFIAPHGIAVDSSGAIYVAELSYTVSGKKLGADAGRDLVTLQKLCPLPVGP
jgi:DNA-binding beta-propeller fold protein YncE